MKLWLDDLRPAPKGWVWAKDFESALNIVCSDAHIDEISLDHDLGEGPTGYNLLCNIESLIATDLWRKEIPRFSIHSANPVGRQNMQRAIDSILRRCEK